MAPDKEGPGSSNEIDITLKSQQSLSQKSKNSRKSKNENLEERKEPLLNQGQGLQARAAKDCLSAGSGESGENKKAPVRRGSPT